MAVTVEEKPVDKMEQLAVFKNTVDFSELFAPAKAIQSKCVDYTIPDQVGTFYDSSLKLSFSPEGSKRMYFPMTDHSFSQLCAKISVPVRYMKKCIDDGEVDLVSDNMNTWLEKLNKPLFIRTYDNKVRGVLSDKFSVLDTPDILNVVSDTMKDFKVKGYYMNEERLHVRAIQNQMMNIAGEDLFAGVQIDSSDVGRSILNVRFLVYKQVCTNGLVISQGDGVIFEQKHIGITTDQFYNGLHDNLERLPDLVAGVTSCIIESKSAKLTKDAIDFYVQSFRNELNLTEDTGNKVVNLMNEKYGNTHWGLINGITEVAQVYTLERRIELEKYAGKLLRVA